MTTHNWLLWVRNVRQHSLMIKQLLVLINISSSASSLFVTLMYVTVDSVSYEKSHQTQLLVFNMTRSSNSLSDIRVRRLFIVSPAQLNNLSDAALAGRGVFSVMNSSFSSGHTVRVVMSSVCVCMYCVSTSCWCWGALLREKKSSSSVAVDVLLLPSLAADDVAAMLDVVSR